MDTIINVVFIATVGIFIFYVQIQRWRSEDICEKERCTFHKFIDDLVLLGEVSEIEKPDISPCQLYCQQTELAKSKLVGNRYFDIFVKHDGCYLLSRFGRDATIATVEEHVDHF